MLEQNNISEISICNQHILITGGTGSLGKVLVNFLLQNRIGKRVVIFSRDEHKQFLMRLQYPEKEFPQLEFVLGDIRDEKKLLQATQSIDVIFHLAALKHVHIAEQNPLECIKTNILGSENLIQASIINKVQKVIALSSDKASSPHNLYGATKFCADKLFVHAQKQTQNTTFAVLRLGNVMHSRGSVFEIFERIKSQNTFYITHPKATRFIISIQQALQWLLFTAQNAKGGEIIIPKVPAFKIIHLAKALSNNPKIVVTGLRPGEKLHEHLINETDALTTADFDDHYIIYPDASYLNQPNIQKLPENFVYVSSEPRNLLPFYKLKQLLKNHPFAPSNLE